MNVLLNLCFGIYENNCNEAKLYYVSLYYGLFPLILFTGLIIVIVSAIALTLEYFRIVGEIRYNELLLQSLIEEYL